LCFDTAALVGSIELLHESFETDQQVRTSHAGDLVASRDCAIVEACLVDEHCGIRSKCIANIFMNNAARSTPNHSYAAMSSVVIL
jgi:hypothetical protein